MRGRETETGLEEDECATETKTDTEIETETGWEKDEGQY